MNAQELHEIEQRLKEGYYEADQDALETMQRLLLAIRRCREEAATGTEESQH
jgi:hypothetical protein